MVKKSSGLNISVKEVGEPDLKTVAQFIKDRLKANES